MGYRQRYEDSYLDKEEEEFSGDASADGDKAVALIQKGVLTENEQGTLIRLLSRMYMYSRMPAGPGQRAIDGLKRSAEAYAEVGKETESTEIYAGLMEIAEEIGNKELYYLASDKMLGI